ncbi:MAG TPA: NnrS family protein, partial [Stellaceae bacterium]|nr:NnrS family protein [Stellaceae bacterium]
MAAIPRYRPHRSLVIFSAGFRPFFLGSAVWAAAAIPLWLAFYRGEAAAPSLLAPFIWHAHEMIFGFAAATVAGFLLTAIPNWTGRMPLQGWPLGTLVALWAIGRIGVFCSADIGGGIATLADLSFPAAFLGVVGREILAGRNWRNLPIVAALALLLLGNLLVHLDALGVADSAELGNRLGLVTLLLLIALVGGRIIPSFTHNWLKQARPAIRPPIPEGRFDRAALVVTALALISWALAPDARISAWATLV